MGTFTLPDDRSIRSVLRAATAYLEAADVPNPHRHAELLLGGLLRRARHELYVDVGLRLTESRAQEYVAALDRRAGGEPTQYILGRTEFYGLQFACDRRALIPRPETEHLVDAAIASAKTSSLSVLELGTGTGCIAVSLAVHLQSARIVATDASADALDLARTNATANGVLDRIEFRVSDLFAAVPESFDFIVGNLPYIPDGDRESLQREIRDHEPASALFGGTDGLDVIRRGILEAPLHLVPDGTILLEVGLGQDAEVERLFVASSLWSVPEWTCDYQGIRRVVSARKL